MRVWPGRPFRMSQKVVADNRGHIGDMKARDIIDAFVTYLSGHGHLNLRVNRRPDEENRDSSDIDAIAGSFAIEHTSIDTLPDQRRDSDWFMQVVGGLEQELSDKLQFRLHITIECNAVTKGQNWRAIREMAKSWITNEAPRLADGRHILGDVSGVPFRLHIIKESDRLPRVVFSRFEPYDNTLPDRVRHQFDRKVQKLKKYQCAGKTTVLLIESDDLALMNEWKMIGSIRKAYPTGFPHEVDQIWYADTSIPSEIEFWDFTSKLR